MDSACLSACLCHLAFIGVDATVRGKSIGYRDEVEEEEGKGQENRVRNIYTRCPG